MVKSCIRSCQISTYRGKLQTEAQRETVLWSARWMPLLIRQTHASLGRVCILTPENKDESIIAAWGKNQDKMTRPRFDTLFSLLPPPPAISRTILFVLIWIPFKVNDPVSSWLKVTLMKFLKKRLFSFFLLSLLSQEIILMCAKKAYDSGWWWCEMKLWQHIFI